jgi:hypothetical protein
VIYINAGKDATLLFDSYHSDSARFVSFLSPSHSVAAAKLTTNLPPSFFFIRSKVLDKYYIGELQRVSGDELFVDYSETQDAFYRTVKQRVRKYFKFAPLDPIPFFFRPSCIAAHPYASFLHLRENNLNPRVSIELYVKSAIVLFGLLATYFLTFFCTLSFRYSLALSLLLGFWKGQVGMSIQHDANHGAFSTRKSVGVLMGITLDAVGASSFYWQQQHVCGHHTYTNVIGKDPDIRVSDKDIRRVAESHPLHGKHRAQHIYLGFLYGLLTLKSIFLDDFVSLATGRIGAVKVSIPFTALG